MINEGDISLLMTSKTWLNADNMHEMNVAIIYVSTNLQKSFKINLEYYFSVLNYYIALITLFCIFFLILIRIVKIITERFIHKYIDKIKHYQNYF